ncbi:TIR domain-containing protein [Streptomyces sp. NPDC018029]|uniref:TIR domain-containing protein n=1 Tax=Streptomyces sp. NPDC018029 TaxID=3365032 RepID=UPI0037873877
MSGSSRIRQQARTPAYFSHSYWAEDRELNEYFWDIFWDEGFTFAVDPKTNPLSPTHLELLMRQSACLVGVVTRREEERRYRASPFMVHEHDLALQAKKPRLVFMENGVSAGFFPVADEQRVVFNRRRLPGPEELRPAIARLAARSGPEGHTAKGLIGTVGLILPDDPAYRAALPHIRDSIAHAGYASREIPLDFQDVFEFLLAVDACDFVILDVASPRAADWVFPLLHGRFVPTLKLIHEPPDGSYVPRPSPLLSGAALRAVEQADRIAVYWSHPEQLGGRLQDLVDRFYRPRLEFETYEEGIGYFRSLGRAEGSVFLSNAFEDNSLAQQVCRAFELHNLPYFHYLRRNSIELGADWHSQLSANVAACRVFVPLISQRYWDSKYCREEYRIAERLRADGQLVILPYFLEAGVAGQVSFQGRSVDLLGRDEQVAVIGQDVDREFVERRRLRERLHPGRSLSPGGAAAGRHADIAVISLLPEAHQALRRHVETTGARVESVRRGAGRTWLRAGVEAVGRSTAYELVLAEPCCGPDGVRGAFAATIEEWRPETVVFVGLCCGLEANLAPGDVVISSRVHGYTLDKLDQACLPRTDRSHLAHEGIMALGESMHLNHASWAANIYEQPPATPPRESGPGILVGAVASGDSPVDGSADPALRSLLDTWPDLAAVELDGSDAAGAVTHVRRAGRTHVPVSLVCGVAGTERAGAGTGSHRPDQDKLWRAYASDAAATLLVEAIRRAWPSPPRRAG